MLAEAVPLNGPIENFTRFEWLVPPRFDRYFYYQVGVTAMARYPNELPKAVAAVDFLRYRSATAHHLALVGIYRQWQLAATLDRNPEALVTSPAPVAPELSPHYWRALAYLAGRYWYENDRSLNQLHARLQEFVPQLDSSVQKYFLQGVGEFLFIHLLNTPWVPPAELERFPHAYQEGLLEGWGMALGEVEHFSILPWKGHDNPFSAVWTRGLSARSLVSVQQGKAQFDTLFEGPASSALKPTRSP